MTQVFHWSKWIGIVGLESSVWKIWGFIILTLYVAIEGEAIWKVIKALAGWAIDIAGHRSIAARLSGCVYYTGTLLGMLQCWRLSSSWKGLRKYWASIEWVLSIQYVPPDATLKKRMYLTIGIFAAFTTIEHISNVLSHLNFHCEPSQCLRKYILNSHGFLLLDFEYSDWIGVVVSFMRILATMVWNLRDLLIILTSMGLTSRYKRLNECVAKVAARDSQGKEWREDTEFLKVYLWRKIREAYVKQSLLVKRVDNSLGVLILLSAFFNFYFICLQLFLGIMQEKDTPVREAYYVISIAWLSVRTGYTVVAAADVCKYSTMALPTLYECNAQCYNIEIERLQKQLVNEYVALSGMEFFYLNRTFVLQMSGAVVTYVLVLIQYDDSDATVT
ncbi:gustatory receptor for sugar taste 64a-like [Maniola hyperantus]|uniref:gustatory receptor for sugar taste 64a-like n=1 Tax=Aphantopus hyperantus TaxID=2795564 RepID=UPI00374785E2